MALGWFVLGAVGGVIGTLALVRRGTVDPYAANPSWGGYITGEYWIDPSGSSDYADVDIGEAGHESLAIDAMLNRDGVIEAMLERGLLDEEQAEEYGYGNDEFGSALLFQEVNIPDDIGAANTVGGAEGWADLNSDARLAYAKHEGAIAVIDNNFYAWKVTADVIENILNHLYEVVGDEELLAEAAKAGEQVVLEEGSTGKHWTVPLGEFLVVKTQRDLEPYKGAA